MTRAGIDFDAVDELKRLVMVSSHNESIKKEMLAFIDLALVYETKLLEVLESARRRAFWPHEADLIRKELGL